MESNISFFCDEGEGKKYFQFFFCLPLPFTLLYFFCACRNVIKTVPPPFLLLLCAAEAAAKARKCFFTTVRRELAVGGKLREKLFLSIGMAVAAEGESGWLEAVEEETWKFSLSVVYFLFSLFPSLFPLFPHDGKRGTSSSSSFPGKRS